MSTLGTAYVQIVPSAQGISGKITNAIAPEATKAGQQAGTKISQGIGGRLNTVGKGMMKAGAIATAVSVPIIAGIKKAMDAYQVQNAAETKLTEIYKTRMGATKKAAAETIKLAGALQKEGVVGDEVALSGAQQLATFAKYPSTVNSLMPAMENLLVQQKGLNGTAQDATQIANLMGKVMNGQVGALKRVGISFTEGQEKVLKYGTETEKAAMLSKVITQNVGNMNKAMLATPEGKIQQMKNSLGDLAESLGAAVAPAIASIAQYISANVIPKVERLLNFMQANPIFGKIIVGITGVLALGGPLMTMMGGIISKFGAIGKVIGMISSPIGAVVAAIALFVAAFATAYKNNKTFRKEVQGLVKSLGSSLKPVLSAIMQAFKVLAPVIASLVKTIASALVPIIKALMPVIKTIISVVSSIAKAVIPILVKAIKTIAPIIQGVIRVVAPIIQTLFKIFSKVFNAIAKIVGPIFKKIFGFITNPIKKAKSVISSVVNAIKNFFKFTGIGKTVSKVFNAVKDKIWGPIKKAKDKISEIIDKIKAWFPIDVKKLITFTLPKIGKSYKERKTKGGGSIGQYSFSVDQWVKHATGGIFTRPTLLGGGRHLVGEAGPEAILPLNKLWNQMDKMAMAGPNNVTANYYITVDGAQDPGAFAQELVRKLKVEMRAV